MDVGKTKAANITMSLHETRGERSSRSRGTTGFRRRQVALAVQFAFALGAVAVALPVAAQVCSGTVSTSVTNSVLCNNGGSLNISPPGSLTNAVTGTLNNNTGAQVINQGQLSNVGQLNNKADATVANVGVGASVANTGTLDNSGTLMNLSATGTLSNAGTLNHNAGAYLSNIGSISNTGVTNNRGQFKNGNTYYGVLAGQMTNSGVFNNIAGGSITNVAGSNFTNEAAGTLNNGTAATAQNQGNLSNAGLLNNNAGASFASLGGSLSNTGTIENSGFLANFGASSLSNAGTLNHNAGAYFTNIGSVSNAGTITNKGQFTNGNTYYGVAIAGQMINSGVISNSAGGVLANVTGSTLSNAIGATLSTQGAVSNEGSLSNAGSLTVGSTGTVSGLGSFAQSAGVTQVDGTMTQSFIEIAGGVLKGTGVLSSGNTIVIGAGANVAPGNSPGTLTLDGDVSFAGELNVELASASSYDVLNVLGMLTFESSARINFLLDFSLTDASYHFDFLDAHGVNGYTGSMFGNPGIFGGYSSSLTCTNGGCDLDLTRMTAAPVPEPETYAMLLAGLGLLGFMARRRKREIATLTVVG